MTEDEAARILARFDAGVLTITERQRLIEDVAIAVLRSAVRSGDTDRLLRFLPSPPLNPLPPPSDTARLKDEG